MTKKELVKALEQFGDDEVVIISGDEPDSGWDNIQRVTRQFGQPMITFGGGSPFSDE